MAGIEYYDVAALNANLIRSFREEAKHFVVGRFSPVSFIGPLVKCTMSNFDPNAILRGAQLTVVGGLPPYHRARRHVAESRASIQSIAEPWIIQV